MAFLSLPHDRREFLRNAMRYPLLAALALLGGRLVAQRTGPFSPGTCNPDGRCRACTSLNFCVLPPAQEFKNRRPPT